MEMQNNIRDEVRRLHEEIIPDLAQRLLSREIKVGTVLLL